MGLLRTAAVVILLLVALAPAARTQSATLLSEDFESGLGGWTVQPIGALPAWHLAPAGECGAITAMAACNSGAPACNYGFAGATTTGRLLESPEFPLGTGGPWVIEFDYRKSMD